MLAYIAILVIAFLLGSVPWGLVISKVFYGKDLREEGSGNIGTTNAIRSMGKVGGYAVFLLDFGKGLLSGLIALGIAGLAGMDDAGRQIAVALAFLGCCYGHIFTPWLNFKGGKGIAVAIGCLFVTFGAAPSIIEIALFAVLVVATRYVSVGSMAAALACPLLALWVFWGNWAAWALCAVTGLTVFWAHRANLRRLLAGKENRIGDKKKAR